MRECTGNDNKIALRYNYVFFFANDDYWRAILGEELYCHPNIKIYERAIEGNRFLQFLFRLHWSYSINRKINLPFKSIWFKRMYRQKFRSNLPLCFVYMGANNIRFDGGFTDYVRKQSSKNRQVMLHNDLIAKKCNYDYLEVRKKVDLATTYDKAEAEKYGIAYFPETTYSKLLPDPQKPEFKQDVYFLAMAKDRLPKIIQVYDHLEKNGIKCLFQICGVKPENQVNREGIQYIEPISYKENLQHVLESKCILEIIQGGSSDITTRVLEAIAYRRRLLTDCDLCDESYFNPGQLLKFRSAEEIDPKFIKAELNPIYYDPQLDTDPLKRIYFIQEKLGEFSDEST